MFSFFSSNVYSPSFKSPPATFSAGASASFDSSLEATCSVDAAAEGAGEAVAAVADPVFGLSYAYGEEPMTVFKEMPGWFSSIMEFMMPNTEVALFMQKFMTIFEVALALAIIVGLFTWLANATTIVLVIMFCLSGMFYWVNIWFIFVAFALMNGSGRSFGLDKWVIPWIQKTAGKWWYGDVKSRYGENA